MSVIESMKTVHTMWRNVRRSPYQALAAILIMSLTFLIVSFFIFVLFGSARVIDYFESKPQVAAFFKDEARQAEIDALKLAMESDEKVASVRFVSKQDALKIYREQNKNDPLLLDLVTADILPASLEISTVDIEDLSEVSVKLKSSPIVGEVIFQKDIVATLSAWTNALRKIGIAAIIVLSLVSIFIMMTIIGIKISQKKEDIEIMRLIGASNWYIRWPFMMEGILYGLTGALVGFVVSIGILWYASPFLSSFLRGIPIFPLSPVFILAMLGFEFLLAIFLGTFSSYIAVLRYLKKS